MGVRINYVGHKYNKLIVSKQWRQRERSQMVTMVLATCDCGNELSAKINNLRTGHTASCGCDITQAKHKVRILSDLTNLDFNQDLSNKLSDLINKRFERLVVLSIAVRPGISRRPYARCKCDCGTVKVVRLDALKSGDTVSCGCYRKERQKESSTIHGKCKTIKYRARQSMLSRVHNVSSPAYKKILNNGGMLIDPHWVESYGAFDRDLPEPFKGAHLDRIDNNKGYYKENCRWVTPSENQQNSSQSKVWVVFGETFNSAKEASEFHGVGVTTIKTWCNGKIRHGKTYPPKKGCSSKLKYNKEVIPSH